MSIKMDKGMIEWTRLRRRPRISARNLVSLRHVRQLTQHTLAAAAGVPRSTVSNLESGEGNPSLTVLDQDRAALGAPIDGSCCRRTPKCGGGVSPICRRAIAAGGVAIRPLVPEPVPDEIMEADGLRARCGDGRNASSSRHARVLPASTAA